MADVLIVCVREDEPQAKALADMFEAAGFSIGGAPSNDAALRSSGAGVVVWSQASIRSRPFLDAAQRVINADKAVVASLIEPPPPSSIGDAPSFDLSRWSGDPNDPALDPLFFAVDRMVNTARAGVGAAAAEETAYEPPPAPRAPPPRRAPPPAAPAPRAPSADALGSEAEHWRAIRDSRNASDFMDYLARYGPDGAFSEVAELRLKQLTSQDEAPRAPTRAPARPASRPASRAEAPPRRSDSPVRMPDPPSRRETVLAPARRPSMDRGGGLDRPFDRMADLREPPKGEGGALRTFVLIALLGGAALAGGLYFGGMGDVGASASRPQIEDVAASTPSAPPPDATYEELEEAPSVPLSSTVEEPERPIRIASRPEREPPATTRREEPRTTPRTQTPQQAVTQAASSTPTTGGPISLSPGTSQQTTTTPSPSVATPPPPSLTTPASSTRTDPMELRGPAGSVVWTQRPSQRRISELYPQRALRQGVGGRVQLDCSVTPSLTLNCRIATETPAGEGFGRAALSAASSYRARPTLSDGTSSVGATTRLAVNFQAPQE
jgi:protein TonB